jgi:hypothetical protein
VIASGSVRAVGVVKDELGKRDDSTKAWADSQVDLFVSLEADVQAATSAILRNHPKIMGNGAGRNGADRSSSVWLRSAVASSSPRKRVAATCPSLESRMSA